MEVAASRGWMICVEILLPVTISLEKFASLSNLKCLNKKRASLLSNFYLILLLDLIVEIVGCASLAECSSIINGGRFGHMRCGEALKDPGAVNDRSTEAFPH